MGASDAPSLSRGGDGGARMRAGGSVLARVRTALFRRPSAFVVAVTALTLVVTLVASVTYVAAHEFTQRGAEARAAEEARSFAQHSSFLATGDAFNGYLLILRYADDPVLRSPSASLAERQDALQQLLWLNTNRFSSLAIVDRSGLVLASSDRRITSVLSSDAFKISRANLGPANSDIILPEEGRPGYVEYTAPLRAGDGSVWGFVYGRADPEQLFAETLSATIDGGRNVIINSAGDFGGGVPADLLGYPWRGAPLPNGSVRADIAGVDSICGLGPIGKDTQIDYGWNVASCLPVSLIQVEASAALGDQAQVTVAVAVLAFVLAVGLLRIALPPHEPSPRRVPLTDPETSDAWLSRLEKLSGQAVAAPASAADVPLAPESPSPESDAPPAPEIEPEKTADGDESDGAPSPPPAPQPQIVADVDALSLIEAYERRNLALAERLRELVQARIMIAATQADEAYRLAEAEPDRAAALHQNAVRALEELRERELREMAYELHPGIVRMGLPAALRHLATQSQETLALRLDVDPITDGASSRGGRVTIDPALRLVLFRLVRDAVSALAHAGADAADLSLHRAGDDVTLTIRATPPSPESFDASRLRAAHLSVEAYAGQLSVEVSDNVTVAATVHAPHVDQPEPEVEQPDGVPGGDDDVSPPHVITFTLPEGPPAVHEAGVDEPPDESGNLNVTTFTLEEDTPDVVPSEPPTPGDDVLAHDGLTEPDAGSPDDEHAA